MNAPTMSNKARCLLISGASRGIGAALAKLRYERGDHLLLMSRSPCSQGWDPSRVSQLHIDLSESKELPRRLREQLRDFPPLDAVVSNAGDGRAIAHLEQLSPAQIEASIRTNLLSHILVARSVWPQLRAQARADLIFTGSEAALAGSPRGSVYCASKFGLRGFAQSLRAEAAGSGVRVGIIHPGPVSSQFFDELDFAPHPSALASSSPESIAAQISWMLDAPQDCVVDELVISPRRRQFVKKRPGES